MLAGLEPSRKIPRGVARGPCAIRPLFHSDHCSLVLPGRRRPAYHQGRSRPCLLLEPAVQRVEKFVESFEAQGSCIVDAPWLQAEAFARAANVVIGCRACGCLVSYFSGLWRESMELAVGILHYWQTIRGNKCQSKNPMNASKNTNIFP